MKNILRLGLATVLLSGLLSGCQSTYYSAMEQVGVHKRDILVDRVDSAKEAQQEAQTQFKDALEQYRAVVSFDGGELETLYDKLKAEYDDSESAAKAVSSRIEKVEDVAEALFEEWQAELALYSSASLRRQSERQLKDTRSRYQSLIKAMKRAESRMAPVLAALNDNVLYLKHNLNAKAIGSLKGELNSIRQDVDLMIKEMQSAIQESDRFIANMKSNG
ncbi:Protein of unknown function [Oceanospirillum multiglobuliferum]|uniref:DNA repair protein n=1 Tax=Oceanospirillum multiglobuliferum TaxID=64969 RepID=A0A1T4PUI7_9GAMM|nr:DUF2959 domain-containing protein [Oceanospirillum multiglobuliferum]OPX55318.1 DNA repair protein [Oceanospirillum multiglobuliferum]SJZ94996.1 Protein of unknown function [Oceanospirillum multiglobuliferum]